jgi:hypothetical protein
MEHLDKGCMADEDGINGFSSLYSGITFLMFSELIKWCTANAD